MWRMEQSRHWTLIRANRENNEHKRLDLEQKFIFLADQ